MFVLTHEPPDPPDPAVTFLTGDIGEAVATARNAAGGKNLEILGADVAGQCLRRGLVDEILVYVLPVLLGDGIRFSSPGLARIDLEPLSSTRSGAVTILRFRVRKYPVVRLTRLSLPLPRARYWRCSGDWFHCHHGMSCCCSPAAPQAPLLIYRDGDRWRGAVSPGYDEHGNRVRKKVSGRTRAEVIEKRLGSRPSGSVQAGPIRLIGLPWTAPHGGEL